MVSLFLLSPPGVKPKRAVLSVIPRTCRSTKGPFVVFVRCVWSSDSCLAELFLIACHHLVLLSSDLCPLLFAFLCFRWVKWARTALAFVSPRYSFASCSIIIISVLLLFCFLLDSVQQQPWTAKIINTLHVQYMPRLMIPSRVCWHHFWCVVMITFANFSTVSLKEVMFGIVIVFFCCCCCPFVKCCHFVLVRAIGYLLHLKECYQSGLAFGCTNRRRNKLFI